MMVDRSFTLGSRRVIYFITVCFVVEEWKRSKLDMVSGENLVEVDN